MKRSQIYLPPEQWRLLSVLSDQRHESISELIRRSIGMTYQKTQADTEAAVGKIFGLWRGRGDLPPTRAYVRRLRRSRRLGSRRA